jgi:hypothetical protein
VSQPDSSTPHSQPDSSTSSATCVGPNVNAGCTACLTASQPQTCQANGCYNGYYCNTITNKCYSSPSSASCQ